MYNLFLYDALDENSYETGIKVSREEFNPIIIEPDSFHGEWNYAIKPQIAV